MVEPSWKDLEKLKGGAEFPPIIDPPSPRIKPHLRSLGVPIKPRLAPVSLWALGAPLLFPGSQLLIPEMRPRDELIALGPIFSKQPKEEEARASSSLWSHTP